MRNKRMGSTSAKFYNRLSFFYPIIDLFLKPQKLQLFEKINSYPYGQLLEIGVGNGAHFNYYKTHQIIGIDTSKSMLMRAEKNLKVNIQLYHMNGEALSFRDESFDYIILSHVIAVVDNPEKLMEEIYRVLKPHGKVFILNHFTPNNWLQYFDKAFECISRFFHFRSVFKLADLCNQEKFKLQSEFDAGLFSYFKIVIYEKKI